MRIVRSTPLEVVEAREYAAQREKEQVADLLEQSSTTAEFKRERRKANVRHPATHFATIWTAGELRETLPAPRYQKWSCRCPTSQRVRHLRWFH